MRVCETPCGATYIKYCLYTVQISPEFDAIPLLLPSSLWWMPWKRHSVVLLLHLPVSQLVCVQYVWTYNDDLSSYIGTLDINPLVTVTDDRYSWFYLVEPTLYQQSFFLKPTHYLTRP